jgi:Uma2 family endonuclease
MPSNALRRPWTEDEFFRWLEGQERRYELVDGEPRAIAGETEAMTGGTRRHNRVVHNLFRALDRRLSGGPCEPSTFNAALRIPTGNVRYPDLLVDCGPYRPDDYAANEPVLVAEVLSPSTRVFDLTGKLEEYRTVPSLRHILLLDPDEPRARLHSRTSESDPWKWRLLQGEAADITLTALGVALPLGECYGGTIPG